MVASGEYADRRWPPGRSDPLGLAAIRLEREPFERDVRALSHGCIRVQRWDELVAWLLDAEVETVRRWANGRRTFDEPAPPVPVLIRHLAAFPDDRGRLVHYPDIYQRGPGTRRAGQAVGRMVERESTEAVQVLDTEGRPIDLRRGGRSHFR